MRRAVYLAAGALVGTIFALVTAAPASAEASLQVNPQKYEDTLLGSQARNGFVDVSNPSDATVTIESHVQGFRQADLDGNLEFFDDATLSGAIKPGLSQFDLGPRQAIRVTFTVNPTALPKGGVYAAIFFKTIPPRPSSSISYVAESANVGTLLILQNGAEGSHTGEVSRFSLPFLQFGSGLHGTIDYANTNRDVTAIAFTPKLTSRVLPWGKATSLTGPLVLPLATREFELSRPGSYFGFLPVTITDNGSAKAQTQWVFAVTGWYSFVVPLLAVLIAIDLTQAWLRRRRRPKQLVAKRPMDGIVVKPKK